MSLLQIEAKLVHSFTHLPCRYGNMRLEAFAAKIYLGNYQIQDNYSQRAGHQSDGETEERKEK